MRVIIIFIIALIIIIHVESSLATAQVFINEVQLNTSGDTTQWVELYNAGNEDVNITGWSIVPLSDPSKEEVIDFLCCLLEVPVDPGTHERIVHAKDFFVIPAPAQIWLDPLEETLILKNYTDVPVDQTPLLFGHSYSDCSWSRYPDGSSNWNFMKSTKGTPNSGDVCEGALNMDRLIFTSDKRVRGSGYVCTRTSIASSYAGYLLSSEHGSGIFEGEESAEHFALFIEGDGVAGLSKSDHSVRYGETVLNVTPTRAISYDSKWTESSMVRSFNNPEYIAESQRYATRIDSDLTIRSENSNLKAKIDSEFDGSGWIESNLPDFVSSEEYTGSFMVYKNIHEENSNEIESSVFGDGFVRTDKNIGDKIATYERGTGEYEVEELIDTSAKSLEKDINVTSSPVNYLYAPDRTINRSMMWGVGSKTVMKGVSAFSVEFSNASKLEEVVISTFDVKMLANFSGTARLETIYKFDPGNKRGVTYSYDEYSGDFSIGRHISILPKYQTPHMSISCEGLLYHPGCDRLKYIITLVNDGNMDLERVIVRNIFPSGTSFIDATIQPSDLGSRFGNWSISHLDMGSSVTIEIELQITDRRDYFDNHVMALTVYQYERRGTVLERKLRATDTSVLNVDWSGCGPQNLSVTFKATMNRAQSNILNYRLNIQNLAEEDMKVEINASIPNGTKFINSTYPPSELSEDQIAWTIDRLAPERRRSISFIVDAEEDGLFLSRANIHGRSLDGRELASIDASTSAFAGGLANLTATEYSDWIACNESILSPDYWIR